MILKELNDEFLPNPGAMFHQGRLVVGKVKGVKQPNRQGKKGSSAAAMVNIDMRESVLLAGGDRIKMDDIRENNIRNSYSRRHQAGAIYVRTNRHDDDTNQRSSFAHRRDPSVAIAALHNENRFRWRMQ